MPVSPRKTRSATGALRDRTTPAPAARPAKKGRVISTSKAKANISPVQRLHNLFTDALTMAKSLEVTPDNRAALQNLRKMAVSLLDILPAEERAARDLECELHHFSLSSSGIELATSRKYDPEDRNYERVQTMGCIVKEVVEWLPDIWLAMAEENADRFLILKCLNICSSAVDDLGEEFESIKRLVITNSEKNTVYDERHSVEYHMAWMWREFLVFSAIRGSDTPANEVIDEDEMYEQVFSLFRQGTSDPKNEDGCAFRDEHWSQEMKTVAERLYAERHHHRITEFIEKPSFRLYTSLVSDYPDVKDSLLSSMRERLFLDKPFIRYSDAAEILAAASQTEDIVRLLDHLMEDNLTALHTPTILIIVRYLSKVSNKKHRTRALHIVEDGLKTSKRDALEAVNDLFPGLDDAQLWLRRLLDAGNLTWDEDVLDGSYPERDTNLGRFAELAANGGPLTDPNWAPPVKKPETQRDANSEDEDGYCLEEERQPLERNLTQFIRAWTQILGQWPDEKAAVEVWNRVKFDGSELLFSVVEGAEEALMERIRHADSVQEEKWHRAKPPRPALPPPKSRHELGIPRLIAFASFYDSDESPSCVYGYVTGGLQEVKTFFCQDHRKLR
ncbi:hypothetical protein EV421DRAFT_1848770 [Armillaria borealis]|uniref:Uncharacterized protein n=1 Tax=Armillaria borealis TaxID=47425 RepID=A0AA39IZ81_9AGAR|nr:hypothetical protein EV421DRAFT_1848770 [Armillaria borealis]